MQKAPESSIHAVVTDPPYGVKEFDDDQLEKRANGNGGIWRIPPSFDGHTRSPLPRFTALDKKERKRLEDFFASWAKTLLPTLRPGAHVFVASNSFLSQLVFSALVAGGLEFRGEIIRLVMTLRGGDRPKGAEAEFPNVCSMPRGCYEPWGLLRKPLPPKMTVGECLKIYQTGGLRRLPSGGPFTDVLQSEKTPQQERRIANHPSLKPQSLLRPLVYSALPLGEGIILDPFCGSGSTIAAAHAQGLSAIGLERNKEYFDLSTKAVARLAALNCYVRTPALEEVAGDELQTCLILEERPVRKEHRANAGKSSSLPSSRTRYASRSR
jgi:site-specific DNA-methyltransferase (adenine-specific)